MAESMTAETARALIAEPEHHNPEWLAAWAQGYTDGYDTAAAGAVGVVLRALAEDLAELDRTSFILPGRLARDRRIAAEVADDRHAIPVTQTGDWPPVTIPGGWS